MKTHHIGWCVVDRHMEPIASTVGNHPLPKIYVSERSAKGFATLRGGVAVRAFMEIPE